MLYRTIDNTDNQEAASQWLKLGQTMGWVVAVEEETPLGVSAVDERMRIALVRLREDLKNEGKKMYGYDYAWILKLIEEFNRKKKPEFMDYVFSGTTDYRSYLLNLGIERVAGVSVLNEYSNLIKEGTAPDWRFKDEPNPNEPNLDKQKRRKCTPYERTRRNGIVRRFLAIYRRNLAIAA